MYQEYQKRILWKANELENARHDKVCSGLGVQQWCKCRTRQEEIHEWEDFVIANFGKDMGEIRWEIPKNVLSKVRS